MPRTVSSDLQTALNAGIRRDTLDVFKADNTVLRLSRGAVTRSGNVYNNWIRSIDEFTYGLESEVDRLTVRGQNVNSTLGLYLASDLRLLDYACAEYGRVYQSVNNPAIIVDLPQMFRCVLANAEIDTENASFEVISDLDSMGALVASRTNSPRCWWTYKNGIECTSPSLLPTCPRTRAACKVRLVEHEFGGTEFFEEPIPQIPTGNEGGIGSGEGGSGVGGGEIEEFPTCFLPDTKVWTKKGGVPIGDMPLGKVDIPHYSFDPETETVVEDVIEEVFEHETVGYFSLTFGDRVLKVTREHPLFAGAGRFKKAEEFGLGDEVRVFGGGWTSAPLLKIKWHSDARVTVRNLHSRRFPTYFADRFAVHNKRAPGGGLSTL